MTKEEQRLNTFLVQVFNDILRKEQAALRGAARGLSLSELHVLEAVLHCGEDAGMAEVAALLGVTCGTLTVAAKTLEQKGYVARVRGSTDKRRVRLSLTKLAVPVLRAHEAFHASLVAQAAGHLTPQEISALSGALSRLHTFFTAEQGENV